MSNPNPMHNKLSQFWKEVVRRKVIKTIAMYAATAFIIMEAADIMLPRLGLPDWTVTLIIVLLILGFPITIIASWFIDLSQKGLHRDKSPTSQPIFAIEERSGKRKIRVSDVLIIVLLIVVGILAYPKIFPNNLSVDVMTYQRTIINEEGEKEIYDVFKEDFITEIVIFNFSNESKDSANQWLDYGISTSIRQHMSQFKYIRCWTSNYTTMRSRIKDCNDHYLVDRFFTGSVNYENDTFNIRLKLHKASNGSVLMERSFLGTTFIKLIDSISLQIRYDLGIPPKVIHYFPEYSLGELLTYNLEALKLFLLRGGEDGYQDANATYKATVIDSTFAKAWYELARYHYRVGRSQESIEKFISKAYQYKGKLSESEALEIRRLDFEIFEEIELAIEFVELQCELNTGSEVLLRTLVNLYYKNGLFNKAKRVYNELLKINPENSNNTYYNLYLAFCYRHLGKLNKALRIFEKLIVRGHSNFLRYKLDILMLKGEYDNAIELLDKMLLYEKFYYQDTLYFDAIEYLKIHENIEELIEPRLGTYRYEGAGHDAQVDYSNGIFTIDYGIGAYVYFPFSDTGYVGLRLSTFVHNKQNEVVKIKRAGWDETEHNYWKEDSLILSARKLLENGKNKQALKAFKNAYYHNPEFYYLENIIKHLEFVTSDDYKNIKSIYDSYLGEYDGLVIYKEDGEYYYDAPGGYIYKILPLSKHQFIVPRFINRLLTIEKTGDSITGARFTYINKDSEIYHSRINKVRNAK